jgi:hypothetical protein
MNASIPAKPAPPSPRRTRGGMKLNEQNVFDDFIAADHLETDRYRRRSYGLLCCT